MKFRVCTVWKPQIVVNFFMVHEVAQFVHSSHSRRPPWNARDTKLAGDLLLTQAMIQKWIKWTPYKLHTPNTQETSICHLLLYNIFNVGVDYISGISVTDCPRKTPHSWAVVSWISRWAVLQNSKGLHGRFINREMIAVNGQPYGKHSLSLASVAVINVQLLRVQGRTVHVIADLWSS